MTTSGNKTKPHLRLSNIQKETLDAIESYTEANGYPPTIRELAIEIGHTGIGNVHRQLNILQAKGYITREARKSRSIKITSIW